MKFVCCEKRLLSGKTASVDVGSGRLCGVNCFCAFLHWSLFALALLLAGCSGSLFAAVNLRELTSIMHQLMNFGATTLPRMCCILPIRISLVADCSRWAVVVAVSLHQCTHLFAPKL